MVTVAVFHGPVQYVLHNGSRDPGPRYAGLLHVGPLITGTERQRLLAAFNGGFLLSSHSGGYEQEGHVIRGLRTGLGTVVIDRSGRARVGVWGAGLPVPGEAVSGARQNLWPLVVRPADRAGGHMAAVGRNPGSRRIRRPQRPRPGQRR